jgi:hypothetical protein
MKNFLILGLLVSSIASAEDSQDLNHYLNRIENFDSYGVTTEVSKMNRSDLSSLHERAGLARTGKCGVAKTFSIPFVAVGALVSSIFLEGENAVVQTWDAAFEDGSSSRELSFGSVAADVNPINVYEVFSEKVNKGLDCKNLGKLHQIAMNEVTQRQINAAVSTETKKAEAFEGNIQDDINRPVSDKKAIKLVSGAY